MLSKRIMSYIQTQLKIDGGGHISDIVELGEGKSEAQVYRTKVVSSCSTLSGIYIIKLINTASKWFSPMDNEGQKCRKLHQQAKDFCDHLVELVASEEVDGYVVLLYRQANDSILNSDTLDKLKWAEKAKYLGIVSYELLSGMNANFRQDGRPEKFFQDVLKYRLEDNGNFYRAAMEILEAPTACAVLIGTKVYPNPIYYIKNLAEWLPRCQDMVLMRGNVHGDLHGLNILCTKDLAAPEDLQYSIIDYDSYEADGYLLFDHAYLELYLYFKLFPENDFEQWRDTLAPLLKNGFHNALEAGVDDYAPCCRNSICSGIRRWQEESLPHMRDDLEIQFYLARIAAGANFFSKGAIADRGSRIKFLIYMGLCFETLFQKLSFSWPSEDPSPLKSAAAPDPGRIDHLWKICLRYATSYTPVLLTDDSCRIQCGGQLAGLALINWRMVIDIGSNRAPDDISTWVPEQLSKRHHINFHSTNGSGSLNVSANDCEWIVCKKEEGAYRALWLRYQRKIKQIWQSVRSFNRMKPYLFIFDAQAGRPFAEQFLSLLLENIEQLAGSHFISLQDLFSQDDIASFQEYSCACENCGEASLVDLAAAAQNYFAAEDGAKPPYISLPHLDSMSEPVLTEKELAYYRTSVELVYSGMENDDSDCDFGASFYRGNEIKWRDIANRCDLDLDENYSEQIQGLRRELIDNPPRIRRLKLTHGAGTGGTTLSKRILWDLKETTPAMRLLHYTEKTADILLEIYRKTGKVLLLSVEMGSTVINYDDLGSLISAVDSENGKLWVLQIERSHGRQADTEEQAHNFIELQDTMKLSIARRFFDKFRQMTTDRRRHDMLNHITNLAEEVWMAQRSPFFYGFYTFQEEYNLEHIQRTVARCDQAVRDLLSDMALMTIYSQNIGVPTYEMTMRLSGRGEMSVAPAVVLDQMDPAVAKIIVYRESGLRICHKIIAEKILDVLYEGKEYGDRVSAAAMSLIDRLYQYYGEEDESVDEVLRELFIDRAVVDNERMKFSFLIGDIEKSTQKEAIFQKLIDLYPCNPHYLNHMARLLVSKEAADYTGAVELIDKAIDISNKDSVKIHYITKGCIFSKKVFSCIEDIRTNTRRGLYAMRFSEIIDNIQGDYSKAEGAFLAARESGLTSDSYTFFPYIDLECRLVEKLADCDKDKRSRHQLLREDAVFQDYYMEHYGKAVELFDQMRTHCWDNAEDMLNSARRHLDAISLNDSELVEKLNHWNEMTGQQALFARRTYSAALYANMGYSWQKMDQYLLEKIERAMYINLTQNTRKTVFQDVDFWFESYSRLKTFSAERAINIIQDYMPDGYNKEFFLFILQFMRLEKGFASVRNVLQHSTACKGMTPSGVNTSKPRMAYSENAIGCPIISMRYVQRGEHNEYIGLKQFQGTITDIRGSTSAIIQVDKLGLEAVFVPSIRTEDGQKREFTSKNLHDRVKFNLLFSYSGLRAWNIE